MADVYLALLHYPVCNKNGNVVTTAVANMDVHDISRAARTYGVKRFYIVTPVEAQIRLVQQIVKHWQTGYGANYNPSRREAFSTIQLQKSLDDVLLDISSVSQAPVRLVATGAGFSGKLEAFASLKKRLSHSVDSWLLMFGTGSGLADEVLKRADYSLSSISGPTDYNHLSVRSAVSIVLDRLLGC